MQLDHTQFPIPQNLYLLFFINGATLKIEKIAGFNSDDAPTVTFANDIITIDFPYKVWDGISVLPL